MAKYPWGTYGNLFVAVKGVEKDAFDPTKAAEYKYEVLGGTHLTLATKEMNQKFPDNKYFTGRMCRVYAGLNIDQALYLAGIHQDSSQHQHYTSYREEVELCRMQLFDSLDVTGEPPSPKSSWRQSCATILCKEKKVLSEHFAVAQMGSEAWKLFCQVNEMCEGGNLKSQTVGPSAVMKGCITLKQFHMRPLCSLNDTQRVYILEKLKEKEISLKEVKKGADELKTLLKVQNAIMAAFKMTNWQEVITMYGKHVSSETLLQFKGNFEESIRFQDFLKHLKKLNDNSSTTSTIEGLLTFSLGKVKGYALFKPEQGVQIDLPILKSGAFLTIGHAGWNEKDVEASTKEVVDLSVTINYQQVLTVFNVVIICPSESMGKVVMALENGGAGMTQHGFIINETKTSGGLHMTKAVDCFVVGHWSVSRQCTDRHVQKKTTNIINIGNNGENDHGLQPKEVYHWIVEVFSNQQDIVIDVGSGNGNGMLASIEAGRTAVWIEQEVPSNARIDTINNVLTSSQ